MLIFGGHNIVVSQSPRRQPFFFPASPSRPNSGRQRHLNHQQTSLRKNSLKTVCHTHTHRLQHDPEDSSINPQRRVSQIDIVFPEVTTTHRVKYCTRSLKTSRKNSSQPQNNASANSVNSYIGSRKDQAMRDWLRLHKEHRQLQHTKNKTLYVQGAGTTTQYKESINSFHQRAQTSSYNQRNQKDDMSREAEGKATGYAIKNRNILLKRKSSRNNGALHHEDLRLEGWIINNNSFISVKQD